MASKFVLIGDEDKSSQFAIEKVLLESGIDSISTSSGKEVLGIYESDPNRWALIILSCEVSDIDGYETARAIREFEKSNNIAPVNIIGTTDNPDQHFASKTQVAGMNGSIEKPLDKRQLLDMVSRLFSIRKAASLD
ncbi:MAG: response regulator [Endozoicomonas sp. (ex Botrylloides leachii)]|nr:response regulator [Endozoicomonas sp. (ex Botrylloides leachii)]